MDIIVSIYKVIDEMRHLKGPFLIEGIGGYRLLRKLAQMEIFTPDLIIDVQRSMDDIAKTYVLERPDKDWKKVLAMVKANKTVFNQYREA